MFGIGFSEILVIGLIALIFIGPEDLPKFARTLGRLINEFRHGSEQFMEQLRNAANTDELHKTRKEIEDFIEPLEGHRPSPDHIISEHVTNEPVVNNVPSVETSTPSIPPETEPADSSESSKKGG
ncbi:MAG: Sec-independent protein translocase protein TatB [Bdellovibrionaceae bacterium]|nr:Sec-independent protein translocase protein TatB [Pseudobdellovibrionaceae bacterium]MDW8191292.1 Sec-independent protein translocase protein TatB [Pseudobdellovibrionaceae bacterium]